VANAGDIPELSPSMTATGAWLRSTSSPAEKPPVGPGGTRVFTVISVTAPWLGQGHTTPDRHLRGGQCSGV